MSVVSLRLWTPTKYLRLGLFTHVPVRHRELVSWWEKWIAAVSMHAMVKSSEILPPTHTQTHTNKNSVVPDVPLPSLFWILPGPISCLANIWPATAKIVARMQKMLRGTNGPYPVGFRSAQGFVSKSHRCSAALWHVPFCRMKRTKPVQNRSFKTWMQKPLNRSLSWELVQCVLQSPRRCFFSAPRHVFWNRPCCTR